MVLVFSIDIGIRNTAISVLTLKTDFIFVQEVHMVSAKTNSFLGLQELSNLFLKINQQFVFDAVVYELQVSAVKGKSNANILANKFIEAFVVGYYRSCSYVKLFGLQPAARCRFIENILDLSKFKFSKNKHKKNKQLSEYYVKYQLEIIYYNCAATTMAANGHKLDDIYDSIAQAMVAFERKSI